MTTKTLLDGLGASFTGDFNLVLGRQAAASSRSYALSTEDLAAVNAIATAIAGNLTVTATQFGTWNIGTVSTVTNLAQFGGAAINLGAGAVGTGTLRTTQASDSPLVTATGAVGDTAWASGSGSLVALLKTIAGAAIDTTTVSPVKFDQTTYGTTNGVAATVRNPSYETVAASQTDQVMGASGAAGDILSQVLIVPATTSPGAVSIKDGAGSAITIFTGGASSVTTLIPFAVPLGTVAATSWKITTGVNVSAIGIGKFS